MTNIINRRLGTGLCVIGVLCGLCSSCSDDDDFTDSIFDASVEAVDKNSATAPFDQWLYDNFVVPYNTEIQYRFNYPASNLSFQLAPADYEKSQLLAHLIKYLFYDVYTKYGGDLFMKKYGPRIFHFIGSNAYSPTTGTETLGYASAGVKITLIQVNDMKLWREDDQYSANDMEALNHYEFHTMHHEFSHILHQTKSYPVSFGQVTINTYAPRDWQDRDSVESHSLGYFTQYGSSANYEDFVETLSCIITDNDSRCMNMIIDACCNVGVKDKKEIYEFIDSLGIVGLDDPTKPWNNFTLYDETAKDNDSGEITERIVPSFHQADATQHASSNRKTVSYRQHPRTDDKGTVLQEKPESFRDFLDNWVPAFTGERAEGMNAILEKVDIATEWYTAKWGLNVYDIRREVRKRQNEINDYIRDNVTIYPL